MIRLIREVCQDIRHLDMRFQSNALELIWEASETFLISVFERKSL